MFSKLVQSASRISQTSKIALRLSRSALAGVNKNIRNDSNAQGGYDLQFSWTNEEEVSKYPFVWLRDNCRCNLCFDNLSRSRTMLISDLDLQVRPLDVQVEESGKTVSIKWSDGHQSVFESMWLYERSFNSSQKEARRLVYKLDRKPWKSNNLEDITHISFSDVMNKDEALLFWLQQLEIYGFVVIYNAPREYGQVRRLAERVAFIRKTHYGYEFAVKAKPNQSNVAYSSGPLQLHADLPYYEYKPGTQLIHCIVQYEKHGGESLIVDAVNVAGKLRQEFPDLFHILTSTPVDWRDVGAEDNREFFKILSKPMICLDESGEISRVNFSQPQRDSFFGVDVSVVSSWYEAYKKFYEMLNNPQDLLQFKMSPGTIQSFDNLRILHGRTSYEIGLGNREIEGCYIDWDEVRSKRRVLQRQLKH